MRNPTITMSTTMLKLLHTPKLLPSKRFYCTSSHHHQQHPTIDMARYKETFSRRMVMAGLKPHHKIAMGVSGGPDSVALCVLAAEWKREGIIGRDGNSGFVDGLLAIIVDHNLRAESADEANLVRDRVSKMGIRCQIARCDWSDGKPKQGHLQEMARDMRYQIFQNICMKEQIGVLLIAQHADDQAELFILRLSRDSGVLGLAGMAFTSQLFPARMDCCGETLCSHGLLLVRPLLEFSKEDLYRICRGGKQEWVEDPTNLSPLFARNRIRISLRNLSSSIMESELRAIISACRETRSFVDSVCSDLIKKAVRVTNHGYAVIDLEKLDPLKVNGVCLSKFTAVVLQFISQRHRQIRGRTSELVLDYIRNFPCKTSLTAAGCYLSPAPQSKGTKILVCCSPQSTQIESSHCYICEGKSNCTPSELEEIIMDGISYSESLIPDASNVPFLHATSSDFVVREGKTLNILSESTYDSIVLLRKKESEHFKSKTEVTSEAQLRRGVTSVSTRDESFLAGQYYHFMNRFLITWKLKRTPSTSLLPEAIDLNQNSDGYQCNSCIVGNERIAFVRHMIDKDWLYLANLSRGQIPEEYQQHISFEADTQKEKGCSCSNNVRLSAERALRALKTIPIPARRGLPVLVNSKGLLLSILSIGFAHCPYLLASAVFKPRVPLGGGHSSFI